MAMRWLGLLGCLALAKSSYLMEQHMTMDTYRKEVGGSGDVLCWMIFLVGKWLRGEMARWPGGFLGSTSVFGGDNPARPITTCSGLSG